MTLSAKQHLPAAIFFLIVGILFGFLLVKELRTGMFVTRQRPALGGSEETYHRGEGEYGIALIIHGVVAIGGIAIGVINLIDAFKKD